MYVLHFSNSFAPAYEALINIKSVKVVNIKQKLELFDNYWNPIEPKTSINTGNVTSDEFTDKIAGLGNIGR